MEFIGDPLESSSSSSSSSSTTCKGIEKVEGEEGVGDLLEECWFFENLLKRRTRMLRCYSDPCSSSSSTKKIQEDGGVICNLTRAPSLPPNIGRELDETKQKEESSNTNNGKKKISKLTRQASLQAPRPSEGCIVMKKKEGFQEKRSSSSKGSKSSGQPSPSSSSSRSLLRTPSLPLSFDINEDKESDTRMSNLIQQAFATSSSDNNLQQRYISKGMTQSYSIPRYRPPRNTEMESINNTSLIKQPSLSRKNLYQGKMKKSSSDLEYEEVQGFKDLGFTFEKEDLNPGVVKILPGLQEKKQQQEEEEELKQQDKIVRNKPYLSEAWLVRNPAPPPPPVPNWVAKNSAADMKSQIKFWARSVASNVRQEC